LGTDATARHFMDDDLSIRRKTPDLLKELVAL